MQYLAEVKLADQAEVARSSAADSTTDLRRRVARQFSSHISEPAEAIFITHPVTSVNIQ